MDLRSAQPELLAEGPTMKSRIAEVFHQQSIQFFEFTNGRFVDNRKAIYDIVRKSLVPGGRATCVQIHTYAQLETESGKKVYFQLGFFEHDRTLLIDRFTTGQGYAEYHFALQGFQLVGYLYGAGNSIGGIYEKSRCPFARVIDNVSIMLLDGVDNHGGNRRPAIDQFQKINQHNGPKTAINFA